MSGAALGFGARLVMAFILPWRLIFDGALASRVKAAADGAAPALPDPAPEPTPAPAPVAVVEAEIFFND